MDSFGKLDLAIDAACKRNEKLYRDLCKDLNKEPTLTIEMITNEKGDRQKVKVEEYIKKFKWDNGRY